MRHKSLLCAISATLTVMSSQAYAGPGANVQACVYLAVDPVQPLEVKFTAGGSGDMCMNDHGKNATLKVTRAGLSCTSVGYVEGNAAVFSTCFFSSDSIWNLSYTAANTPYTGSMKSSWWYNRGFGDNKVILMDPSPGTTICTDPTVCKPPVSSSDPLRWLNQGPLYFIFTIGGS